MKKSLTKLKAGIVNNAIKNITIKDIIGKIQFLLCHVRKSIININTTIGDLFVENSMFAIINADDNRKKLLCNLFFSINTNVNIYVK